MAYQARHINYHASLAVWGGNNEVEASLGWYEESRANRELYSNDYTALFVDTVRAALLSVSPHAVYLDSSPSKGVLASGPSFYVKRWGDVGDWKRGDVHFYTTTDNALNISTFPRAKFVSGERGRVEGGGSKGGRGTAGLGGVARPARPAPPHHPQPPNHPTRCPAQNSASSRSRRGRCTSPTPSPRTGATSRR